MTNVYFVADPFASPPLRLLIGYMHDCKFEDRDPRCTADDNWHRLSREQQACVRLCLGRLRAGDDVGDISPQLVVVDGGTK